MVNSESYVDRSPDGKLPKTTVRWRWEEIHDRDNDAWVFVKNLVFAITSLPQVYHDELDIAYILLEMKKECRLSI